MLEHYMVYYQQVEHLLATTTTMSHKSTTKVLESKHEAELEKNYTSDTDTTDELRDREEEDRDRQEDYYEQHAHQPLS